MLNVQNDEEEMLTQKDLSEEELKNLNDYES